ncbi:MAG: hypothetical protein ACE5HH_00390 [Candidatus Hydrothermarchaeales archaeon]
MAELVIIVGQSKNGVLNALKMKSMLEKTGITVMGIITKETDDEKVPLGLVEDILKLKIMANFNIERIE